MRAQDVLPDNTNEIERGGVVIRKGSVGAFLVNAKTFCDPAASEAQRQVAAQDIADSLPALRALGLFEVLAIRDPALRQFVDSH